MAQLMSNMNPSVFKLPLGMIRVIELPMAILAFATTSGYSSTGYLSCAICTTKNAPLYFGYPFYMDQQVRSVICDTNSPVTQPAFTESFVSQSQFFVFTGVMSFLYILAIIAFYLFFWHVYENDAKFPLIDFVVTTVFALFWFAGSCAWASGVTGLKTVTGEAAMKNLMLFVGCNTTTSGKQDQNLSINDNWNYASLNVSLIAGFACCGLWIANLWFIYKETAWYKARAAAGAGGPQPPPPNISSPTNQTYR